MDWYDNLIQNITQNKASSLDMQDIFYDCANNLMNNYQIKINNKFFDLLEIEFYYYDKKTHPDKYTHRNEMQKHSLQWYLHRFNNSIALKGGTRKGLDITFGTNNTFGGILVRAIRNTINDDEKYGPSLTVDKIMEELTIKDIKILSNLIENQKINETPLRLVPKENVLSKYIYRGPRIHLSPPCMKYYNSYYRFVLLDTKTKSILEKEKIAYIAYKMGRDIDEIRDDLGYKMNIEAYEKNINFWKE